MMRPFTCLSLVTALGAGLCMYQEKHETAVLDHDISTHRKHTDQVLEHISALKLEMDQLTNTARLGDLVAHHMTNLQTPLPAQYARLDDLPNRLPAIGAPQAPSPPPDDMPATTVELPPAPEPIVAAAKPNTVQVATRQPPKPRPPAPKPREPEVAAYTPPRPSFAPVMPAYVPAPVAVHAPMLQTASATAPSPYGLRPYAAPSYAPAPYSPPAFSGSSLGMARSTLPPPVPVGTP